MPLHNYCFVSYVDKTEKPSIIVETKMICLKIGKSYYGISTKDYQSKNLYIVNCGVHDGNVQILDVDDDEDSLRDRNNSGKRIKTVRSNFTPCKKPKVDQVSTSNDGLMKLKKNKGLKQKNAGKLRKSDKENMKTAKKNGANFFRTLINSDDGDDIEISDDHPSNAQPPLTPRKQPSPAVSPAHSELSDGSNLSDVGDNSSVEVEQLRRKIARQEKEISSLKNKIVTKAMLEDGLQMVVNEITKNNENGSQPNRRPINHPPLNNNAEVQVTPDFSMPYKMYLQALHAPDMRKRAVRVMHVLWDEERRGKLLIEADPKRPELEIVTDQEYLKIIGVCMALQEIKFIECRQKDDAIAYLRDWTSVWLKNWKPQKKAKRQSNRRT